MFNEQIMMLLKMQKLTGFVFFCAKLIGLSWVFMQTLLNLEAKFTPGGKIF